MPDSLLPAQSEPVALSETLFHSSAAYFSDILQAIDRAQKRIDMEVYIYERKGIGKQISEALIRAAGRGVEVHLLVDGVGIDYRFDKLAAEFTRHGIQVRIFHPLPWRLKQWPFSATPKQGWSKFWYLLTYLNQRNHRKMLLIDRTTIWIGSINVSQSHLSENPHHKAWRDTSIRISGVDVTLPEQAFELAWNRSRLSHRNLIAREYAHSSFVLNFSRYLRRRKRRKLLHRIHLAKQRIWVTNAYFAPERILIKALTQASKRGVDVRILLPSKSDIVFMPLVAAFFYQHLITHGVKVYEFQPSMLHSKTLVIDDWGCVGSSNLNRRSLSNDLEIDYPLQTQTSVDELAAQFKQDLMAAKQLDGSEQTTPRWKRWLGALLLMTIGRWL